MSFVLRLAAVAPFLLACASPATSSAPPAAPDPSLAAPPGAFAPSLCQDAICWLAPAPQGNPLRAVATSKTGTSFAVGDHGVVLRSRGDGWQALALPMQTAGDGTSSYRNLRAVHVIADDDVWIAGELGAVHHFDGKTFTELPSPDTRGAELVSIWASSPTDVWIASAGGHVWHHDGTAWSESLYATVDGVRADLAGMWAAAADDIWVVGSTSAGVTRLWHFDGAAWADEKLAPEVHDELLPAGRPVGISGAVAGEPYVAFQHRVVARDAGGRFRAVYHVPRSYHNEAQPLVGLFVPAVGDMWLAHDAGSVQHVRSAKEVVSINEGAVTDVPGFAFGSGPGGRTLVLRAGGRIADPDGAAESRAIDVRPFACAPAGGGAACVEKAGETAARLTRPGGTGAPETVDAKVEAETQVRANAAGTVAIFTPTSLAVRAGGKTRRIPVPAVTDGLPNDVTDVAVMADERVFVLTRSCELHVAAPGATTLSRVPAKETGPRESFCRLHVPSASTVFVSSSHYVNDDAPDDSVMIVRSQDGAVVQRAVMPRLTVLDPVVTVTASGKVFLAGARRGALGPGESFRNVWRLDGKTWKPIAVRWNQGEGEAVLAAFGETVVAHVPSPEDATSGAVLQVLDGEASRDVKLPTHGISRLHMVEGGVFGVRSASEATCPAFPEAVHSVFFAKLGL